jgi:hypothetical protein
MPNAQAHLIAGTLVAIAVALLLRYAFGFGGVVLLLGAFLLIIASEFPDVDHEKSLPRKIMRGLVPGLVIFATIYAYLNWHMWTAAIYLQLLIFAVPIAFILIYEKFIPKHRGALHKYPGMIVMIAIVVILGVMLKMGFMEMLVLSVFAAIGFGVHILADALFT